MRDGVRSRRFTDFEDQQAIHRDALTLSRDGWSRRAIADAYGVGPGCVSQWLTYARLRESAEGREVKARGKQERPGC